MKNTLLPWTKVAPGLYIYKDKDGQTWHMEHCTKKDGYIWDEWHVGTEDDLDADAFDTMTDADYSLFHHLNPGH